MPMHPAFALPVSYSLVSSQALQRELLPLYFHPQEAKAHFIYQGMHDTYLIQGPVAKFIFRIYRVGWKTFRQVEAELQLLLLLQNQGLSVAYPIADQSGVYIHRITCPEGERYGVLFAYASGEKLPSLTPELAYQFGKYMADLHLITRGRQMEHLQRDYTPGSILAATLRAVKTVLPDNEEVHRTLERVNGALTSKLTPAVLQELTWGICHGDPHHENVFVEPVTHTVTMFDFDFSGNGFLLYDVGSFCFYERHRESNIASFLKGYTQTMPLTRTELEAVPFFTVLVRLFHLGARSTNADGIRNSLWFPEEIAGRVNDIEKEVFRLLI